MSRGLAVSILLLLLSAGCGGPETPSEPAPDPGTSVGNDNATLSGGTELAFWGKDVPPGVEQPPTFWVSADRFTLEETGGEKVWMLEGTTAMLAVPDGDDANIKAGRCRFDEASRTAELSGDVTVRMGAKTIELTDMIWLNEEGVARSDNKLTVADGPSRFEAEKMAFTPSKNELVLEQVLGTVRPDAEGTGGFKSLEFVKPAPLVEFEESLLRRMSGGVDLSVVRAEAEGEPLALAAETMDFTWSDGKPPTLSRIDLEKDVRVKADQGDMRSDQATLTLSQIVLEKDVRVEGDQGNLRSDRATLDLDKNRLSFSGAVQGSTEQIARFDCDRVDQDLETGDAKMFNLTAKGLPASGFAGMDIEKAPVVQFRQGELERINGGVRIQLQPSKPGEKGFLLRASEVTFTRPADGGEPTAIHLRNNVQVDGPKGTITARNADFDTTKQRLEFVGDPTHRVLGSTPQIRQFSADKIRYIVSSNDAFLMNLKARNVPISGPGQNADAGQHNYSSMDIETAPEVLLRSGRLEWIKGGVVALLQPQDPKQEPLNMQGNEAYFEFSDPASMSPSRVELVGNVRVNGPEARVSANGAVINIANKELVFTGNVKGDTPALKGFEADKAIWYLATDRFWASPGKIREFELEGDVDSSLLGAEDIRDWPGFLSKLQTQARSADPSPGRRIVELLGVDMARKLASLPTDRDLGPSTQDSIVKHINDLLERDDFYDEAAWSGIELGPEAAGLLGQRDTLEAGPRVRLNRLLFEAAYPGLVAKVDEGAGP